MAKMSCKKLKELIKDEKMASKEYRHYGLPSLAKDEARHRKVLLRELKRRKKLKNKKR